MIALASGCGGNATSGQDSQQIYMDISASAVNCMAS